MKKLLVVILVLFSVNLAHSQIEVKLPQPSKEGGMPLMEALNKRKSSREYSGKELSREQISNMLWAAWGINRENGKHTAPSSRNKQEIDVYMSTAEGLFIYKPENHSLIKVSDEDIRKETGKQGFVGKAPVELIFVADYTKAGGDKNSDNYRGTSQANAAFMSQNVYLWCASEGLATVVRGWFDREELHEIMQLDENKDVIYCQTVGYSK